MKFNDKFCLNDVLYIPKFSFNLRSISQLTSLNCELIFSDSCCVIQDLRTKNRVGTIDMVVGFHILLNMLLRNPLFILLLLNLFVTLNIMICGIFKWDICLMKDHIQYKPIIHVLILIRILFAIHVIKLSRENCLSLLLLLTP